MTTNSGVRAGVAALALCAALMAYFGYFAIYGRHGLMNLARVSHERDLKARELADLRTERAILSRRVDMLKPESIDPDLLEEVSRESLGLTGPGELVLPRAAR